MSGGMAEGSENSRTDRAGKTQSFYVRYENLERLQRMADERGVTFNRMLSVLIEEAAG